MPIPSLAQSLAAWHEFYALLGSASATMVGLLFVAASVGAGVFSRDRMGGLRMFLSASVVHFASVLALSLILLAPIRSVALGSVLIMACGAFGLGYSALAWHGTVRDGISAKIDHEDRIWYAALPAVAYLCETAAGLVLRWRLDTGGAILAAAMGGLLLVAIHNAWDITVWSITRRRD